MSAKLLKEKLSPPLLLSGEVSRERLYNKLDEGLSGNKQVIIVSAPAGSGKTTLIACWARRISAGSAWLRLDKHDNDPLRFFTHFAAAIQNINGARGSAAELLLQTPKSWPCDIILDALIHDMESVSAEAVLILDDFHFIREGTLLDSIQYLLQYKPQSFHIVISTREELPLPLAGWRSKNQLIEIGMTDMRFNTDESGLFLRRNMKLNMTGENVEKLEQKTDGWITGLQLAGLSLKEKNESEVQLFIDTFSGSIKNIYDYFRDEVLAGLDAKLKRFLFSTSVLNMLSAPLCEAVTGMSNCKSMLMQLEISNAFIIPLDEKREWYRYHPLFAEILKSYLDAKEYAGCCEAASKWFETNGYVEEAADYMIAAGNVRELERLILLFGNEMIKKGKTGELGRWLDELPPDKTCDNYELNIFKAWCMFFSGQNKEAVSIIRSFKTDGLQSLNPTAVGSLLTLQSYLQMISVDLPPSVLQEKLEGLQPGDPSVRAALNHNDGLISMYKGDLNAAVSMFRESYMLWQKAGHHFSSLISLNNLAMNLVMSGKRNEAITQCKQALAQYTDDGGNLMPLAGVLYIPMGIALNTGLEIGLGKNHLIEGIKICRRLSLPHFCMQGELDLAVALSLTGEVSAALSAVNKLISDIEDMGLRGALPMIRSIEAEILLKQGNMEAVDSWVRDSGFLPDDIPDAMNEKVYIVYTKVLIRQGRLHDAQDLLAAMERSMLEGKRYYHLITVYILSGIVSLSRGYREKALEHVKKAISIAECEGYYAPFINEYNALSQLMPDLRMLAAAFTDKLILLHESIDKGLQQPAESFSKRELEILALVAAGLSNAEISKKLFISVRTTKWHIANIFTKLNTKSRMQAVIAARKLNLL